jgi:probable HAF family extracellular repeat protein
MPRALAGENMKELKYLFYYTRSMLSVGVLGLMTVLAARGQVCYTITDLGTLGGSFSVGTNINARGQVVGISRITGDSNEHAFLYSAGHMQDLGTFAGDSAAYSINNHGQVVGVSYITVQENPTHAFLYSAGHLQDLGTLGSSFSGANGINNRGQIVGGYRITGDTAAEHAFLYSAGHMQDLGTLGGNNRQTGQKRDRYGGRGECLG